MTSPRAAALAAAVLVWAAACARPGSPRGGPEDRRPPVVVAAVPAPRARVDDPAAVIRFQFSERISERPVRGTLDEAVLVSPATGPVRVEHGRDWLQVHVEGGLRPGLVYRVTVLPMIADLFGNAMAEPFDLVFSTGGEFIENAIAGQALDRITGRPLPDLTVQLLPVGPVPDTLALVARTDDSGLFFFRFVPLGRHNLVAFQDQNRNGRRDAREPFGERGVFVGEDTEPLLADLAVLEPDSSVATLLRTEIMDSVTLRLVFSDPIDPASTGDAAVSLSAPEGKSAPGVAALLHPAAYEARRDSAGAAAGQPPRGGRLPGSGDAMAVPGQERGGLPRGLPLPRAELIAVLDAPLEVGVRYRVSATGVFNIAQIPGGHGEATVTRPPPPRRALPDSTDARVDTAAVAIRR